MKGNNMNMSKIIAVSIVLFLLGGCMTEVDLEQEKALLFKTDQEFAEKSKEVGSAEAFYLYMDKDGMQLPANGDAITGNSVIRDKMKSGGDYQLIWTPQKAEVSKAADMGWTWGKYTYQAKYEKGKNINLNGKYLNVWKKKDDGSWKVAVDIGNIENKK
jgi:ketosteroid isomerase-like protein